MNVQFTAFLLPVIVITSLACVITNDFYFHIPNFSVPACLTSGWLFRAIFAKRRLGAWAYIWLHGYFRFIPLG